jgi:hypothetical protein
MMSVKFTEKTCSAKCGENMLAVLLCGPSGRLPRSPKWSATGSYTCIHAGEMLHRGRSDSRGDGRAPEGAAAWAVPPARRQAAARAALWQVVARQRVHPVAAA